MQVLVTWLFPHSSIELLLNVVRNKLRTASIPNQNKGFTNKKISAVHWVISLVIKHKKCDKGFWKNSPTKRSVLTMNLQSDGFSQRTSDAVFRWANVHSLFLLADGEQCQCSIAANFVVHWANMKSFHLWCRSWKAFLHSTYSTYETDEYANEETA